MQNALRLIVRDIRWTFNAPPTPTYADTLISEDIGPDAEGTDATVATMWALLKATMQRQTGVPAGPWTHGPQAVYDYLRAVQIFTPDPPTIELVRTPRALFHEIEQTGRLRVDCDDIAMLGVYMLAAQHLRPVLAVIAPNRADRFKHIFFGYRTGTGPLSRQTVALMDPQENRPIGFWPDDATTLRLYEATGPHAYR
jgi:hypothetical protein